MKIKNIFIPVISLFILAACGWFIWHAESNKTMVIGVLRTSGLLEEEKQRFELSSVDYQITDFGDYTNAYEEGKTMGYYLFSDNIDENLLGKCVKATGLIPEKWRDKNTVRDAYNRSAMENVKIKIVDSTNCSPYGKTAVSNTEGQKKIILEGIIIRSARPAPDIGYDYKLKLKKPIIDEFSQSGADVPEKLDLIDITPSNNEHWLFLENNINKEVAVKGSIGWGYAESRYFQIADVQETALENLITEFEKYIKTKDVDKLMSLFTPPKTEQEVEAYNNLMGKNPDVGAPRLFNNVSSNFIITDWELAKREYPDNNELITKTDNGYLAVVKETRKGWCNAGPCAGNYSFENTDFYILEIINVNSKWLVDKYYLQNQNHAGANAPKYEALGF